MDVGMSGRLIYYPRREKKLNMDEVVKESIGIFVDKFGYMPELLYINEEEEDVLYDNDDYVLEPLNDISIMFRKMAPSHFILAPVITKRRPILSIERTPV